MAQTTDRRATIPTRVLVLGMAHEDGGIDGAELQQVAEACGQTPEQIRSCLRRLVAEGLFERKGRGASARFEATAAGMAALGSTVERTRLAYAQDAAGRGWDRTWRLVAFAIPETRRAARDALRDRMLALGGAAIQGGLYVSPHPWHKDVRAEAERLGVGEQVTLATTDDLDIGGEHDPRELAQRLWPVGQIAERYEHFVAHYAPVPEALVDLRRRRQRLTDSVFLSGALAMAVEYQEVFAHDPLLPPELLPRPWPGRTARDLMVKSRRLALALREGPGRPALFRLYDDAVEAIQ